MNVDTFFKCRYGPRAFVDYSRIINFKSCFFFFSQNSRIILILFIYMNTFFFVLSYRQK